MAGANRHADAAVTTDREDGGPIRAGVFETVRLVSAAALGSQQLPVGGDLPPEKEAVRFVAGDGFAHPDAEVQNTKRRDDAARVTLTVGFMGLTGPMGVLPDHYTETLLARNRARDPAMQGFLELFDHRAISLFYRAWAKYRLSVRFAESRGDLSDPFSRTLAALAGIPSPNGDPRQLATAATLSRKVRGPMALKRTLALMFDLPVEVVEMHPRRIRIAEDERTRIGADGAARFAALGQSAVLGQTVTDVAGRFQLRIGPLRRQEFESFFDDTGPRALLIDAVRNAAGASADFDLQLVLRRQDVVTMQLGGPGGMARLGQTSWLVHDSADRDCDDAVLRGR